MTFFSPGDSIDQGRYKIQSLLGEGGMGQVYLATQHSLERLVAIKVLHPRGASRNQAVLRFKREARLMATLNHPHCIQIYDYGETEKGLLYIVMEYLQGKTLAEALKERKKFSPQTALHIMSQICSGVFAAHQQNLIHRDLKPANIFLMHDHEHEFQIKVLDFGLAKLLKDASLPISDSTVSSPSLISPLTHSGQIFGTPRYMSPEQAKGELTDHRTDIYALGLIFYQCLTGRFPLSGNSKMEILYAHLHQTPRLISEDLPDISPQIEQFIHQCLSKKRQLRPQGIDLCLDLINASIRKNKELLSQPNPINEELKRTNLHESPKEKPSKGIFSQTRLYLLLLSGLSIFGLFLGGILDSKSNIPFSFLWKVQAKCSDTPTPRYNAQGQVCFHQDTHILWMFNHHLKGQLSKEPNAKWIEHNQDQVPSTLSSKLKDTSPYIHILPSHVTPQGDERLAGIKWGETTTQILSFSSYLLFQDPFTLELWFKPSLEFTKCTQLIGNTNTSSCEDHLDTGWSVQLEGDSIQTFNLGTQKYEKSSSIMYTLSLKVSHSPSSKLIRSNFLINPNNWNHLAITYTDSKVHMMVNGIQKNFEFSNTQSRQTAYRVYIGNFTQYSPYQGQIDELRLSTNIIEPKEIIQAYKNRLKTHLRAKHFFED